MAASPDDTVYAIAIDRQGGKWFAANGGMSVLSGTTWTTYTTANTGGGLLGDYVNAIAIDSNGAMWFGTENGVSVLSGTTWLTYTVANSGLVDNNVMAITIGADGTK
jgi:ligand-binding sensor domain-containing protein